jgi:predicted enzyme related to lactoylglutathione lyase
MKRMKLVVAAFALIGSPALAAEFGQYGLMGVRIAVRDEPRAMEFYKLLGMKVGRLYHPGQQEMTWDKPTQGPNLVLLDPQTKTKLVPGTASFMMFVPDVAATVRALRAAGYKGIEDPKPTKNPATELSIPDPDGNQILLIGPTPK